MIVGTAGHIDHGKSTLIHALTGVDPSRLAEEKRRGISIELGYAFLDTPSGQRIGFVDVPGHERLVHTMLSGATGIDAVMLLVAADDGVMPQTREHLAIISLLALRTGLVVITKTDRVDAARVATVQDEVQALLRGSTLGDAPIVTASAVAREGLDTIRDWLGEQAAIAARRRVDGTEEDSGRGALRLAIDRVFTLAGAGTIVTGSVIAGTIHTGDELAITPGSLSTRARSLRAQNQPTERATRGQRCAVNVAGVAREAIARGNWLCAPAIALETERIDVALHLWRDEPQPLRSGTSVHCHAGAADVMARVILLEGDALAPGSTGLAQLLLHQPIALWRGDRLVLRDAAARRTMAGGVLLDPFAPTRYRRTPQRLSELQAMREPTPAARFAAALPLAVGGIALDRWARAEGRALDECRRLAEHAGARLIDAKASAGTTSPIGGEATCWAIHPPRWEALRQALLIAVERFHEDEPQALGVDLARLRRLLRLRIDAPVVDDAVAELLRDGQLARHGVFLHLPAHGVQLSAAERQLAERLLPLIEQGQFDPPWMRDLARALGISETQARQTLGRMAISGQLFQVVRDLYYSAAAIEELAKIARELDKGSGRGVQAAAFRDRTGLGRKRAIQILEFFDRVGLLRRVRDTHLLRPGSESLFVTDTRDT